MDVKLPLLAYHELIKAGCRETCRQAAGADEGHAVSIVKIVRLNFSLIIGAASRRDAQTRGRAAGHRTLNNFNDVLFFDIAGSKSVIVVGALVSSAQHRHRDAVINASKLRYSDVNTASVSCGVAVLVVNISCCRQNARRHKVAGKARDVCFEHSLFAVVVGAHAPKLNHVAELHVTVKEYARPRVRRAVRLERQRAGLNPVHLTRNGSDRRVALAKVMHIILQHGVVDVNLHIRKVNNRAGLSLRPSITCVIESVVRAEQRVLLLICVAVTMENSVRAGDVSAQRLRDLGRNDLEFLENENLGFYVARHASASVHKFVCGMVLSSSIHNHAFQKKIPTAKFLIRQ